MVLRALMLGKIGRLSKDVILYRKHSFNISSSDNLQKLSNPRIITQYLKDAIHLYNQNQISEAQIGKLLDRINYEYHRREILYKKEKTIVERLKFKLRKFLLLNS